MKVTITPSDGRKSPIEDLYVSSVVRKGASLVPAYVLTLLTNDSGALDSVVDSVATVNISDASEHVVLDGTVNVNSVDIVYQDREDRDYSTCLKVSVSPTGDDTFLVADDFVRNGYVKAE